MREQYITSLKNIARRAAESNSKNKMQSENTILFQLQRPEVASESHLALRSSFSLIPKPIMQTMFNRRKVQTSSPSDNTRTLLYGNSQPPKVGIGSGRKYRLGFYRKINNGAWWVGLTMLWISFRKGGQRVFYDLSGVALAC